MMFVLFILLVIGYVACTPMSDDQNFTTNGSAYQRPEFVDTRPAAEIEKNILKARPELEVKGKPTPNPDPNPTGTDPNPNPAHKYAYIVGISDYQGTQNDLQYCDDDANDWNNYLKSQGFTTRVDLNLNATASAIQAGLLWLRDAAVPGDEIIFAYSGHGNNPSGYGSSLVSADLTYVTNALVAQYIQGANCTKKMVAIDACKAGDFLTVGGANALSLVASQNTYSYDGTAAMNNGVWTYYFMEAVNNGKIYGEDAAVYAEGKITSGRQFRREIRLA